MVEYSAGMVSRLFWLSETRKTAQLIVEGLDKDQIKEIALKENIYQVRAEDRSRRIFRETIKRLETLPENMIKQVATGDIDTAKLLVLIGIMRIDLLFFEFVYEVHRQAILIGENMITDRAVNTFFDQKIAQSEVVARWSESAIKKLKQCYTKVLFDAGVLTSSTGERKIIIPVVDDRLRKALEDSGLTPYLKTLIGD
jgi:hypothetical protein